MITLNLVNEKESDITYKISRFPDGQSDIVLDIKEFHLSGISETGKSWSSTIKISSRFNSFKDLEIIICTTKALRRLGIKEIHLYIPYLLGARSDRQFQEGGNSYLVDVIAPILNAQNYKSITVIDVHSDVAAACINNLKSIDNEELVKFALSHIYDNDSNYGDRSSVLVSPDAGSLKKIYNIAKEIEYKGEIIIANKHREIETGKILSTEINLNVNCIGKDYIIIDDICDGGRTFIELVKAIKEKDTSNRRFFLIITHGIFSARFEELEKYFNTIYCTNSYSDILDTTILCGFKSTRQVGQLVKQLNIF